VDSVVLVLLLPLLLPPPPPLPHLLPALASSLTQQALLTSVTAKANSSSLVSA